MLLAQHKHIDTLWTFCCPMVFLLTMFVGDAVFSYHSPVMFDVNLTIERKLPVVRHGHVIASNTAAAAFSPLFAASVQDELLYFYLLCCPGQCSSH